MRRRKKQNNTIIFGRGEDGKVVEFPLEKLREIHFSISGATGQRKTLFVVSLLLQFFACGDGIVFIDLGGDVPTFWILRRAAEAAGKKLWFFSVDRDLESLYYDPILSFSDPVVASGAVGSGLNLTHAPGYGRSFWGRLNAADINAAFDRLAARGVAVPSFAELTEELKQIAKSRGRGKEISESLLAADQISRLEHFGVAPDSENQLLLRQAIKNGDIVIFHCPSGDFGDPARAIATLAAWSTMVEQQNVLKDNPPHAPPPNTHLVIDEYAQIAAGKASVDAQLTMVRKWHIQMWLIYQNRHQLFTPDGDLYPTLNSNCQRFVFSAETEEEKQDLMNASLDEWKKEKPGRSVNDTSVSAHERWYLAPRLERNYVMEICAQAMKLFGVFKLGDEHRDPIPFEIFPPTKSPEEHAELKATRIPQKVTPVPPTKDGAKSPELLARYAALDELVSAKMAAEWYGAGEASA